LASADDEAGERLSAVWASLGDDVDVRASGPGVWACTVLTDDIGAVIEAAIAVGRPSRIQVGDRLGDG
jgi:hypothetical protein